jgi:aminoglycoside phosphotransferase (APT) family kinase protein
VGRSVSVDAVRTIAGHFALEGEIETVRPLGDGGGGGGAHINDSYRIEVRGRGAPRSYLLQQLNPRVFPSPDAVMENIVHVTRHLAAHGRPTLTLVPTHRGGWWHEEPEGGTWRVFVFLTGTRVREHAESPGEAQAAGRAFGEFLQSLSDYDGPPLHETIPGFHDTRARLARLEAAHRADPCARAGGTQPEFDALMDARGLADVLPPLVARDALPRRIVHNDAKLANVLLDERTGEAVCVVDLDTVMPGLALYDFGDLVRSVSSPAAEDEEDLSLVAVSIPLFTGLARGWLETAGAVLTPEERDLLVFAGRLVTFEQAVRFLTDYLEGDRYYRIERPDHNLARCRTQLALLGSLTRRASRLEAIIGRA